MAHIKVLSERTKSLGLDFVVFSYYEKGEIIPSVSQVRAKAREIYEGVLQTHLPAAKYM